MFATTHQLIRDGLQCDRRSSPGVRNRVPESVREPDRLRYVKNWVLLLEDPPDENGQLAEHDQRHSHGEEGVRVVARREHRGGHGHDDDGWPSHLRHFLLGTAPEIMRNMRMI